MKKSAFLFFKGLGLLFAILCGIGTAFLGWYDGADWMNIATYSIAVTGLILWGWYHFSVRWINEDLKQNIFTKFPKEEIIKDEEDEENFFFKNIRENKWKTIAFLGVILIFIFVSFVADDFFSGRTLVSFLIFFHCSYCSYPQYSSITCNSRTDGLGWNPTRHYDHYYSSNCYRYWN